MMMMMINDDEDEDVHDDDRSIHRRSEASCGAVCLGVISLFLGFLLGVIYFAIRSITTSLQNTEVVPTYSVAFLLLSSGKSFTTSLQKTSLLTPSLWAGERESTVISSIISNHRYSDDLDKLFGKGPGPHGGGGLQLADNNSMYHGSGLDALENRSQANT